MERLRGQRPRFQPVDAHLLHRHDAALSVAQPVVDRREGRHLGRGDRQRLRPQPFLRSGSRLGDRPHRVEGDEWQQRLRRPYRQLVLAVGRGRQLATADRRTSGRKLYIVSLGEGERHGRAAHRQELWRRRRDDADRERHGFHEGDIDGHRRERRAVHDRHHGEHRASDRRRLRALERMTRGGRIREGFAPSGPLSAAMARMARYRNTQKTKQFKLITLAWLAVLGGGPGGSGSPTSEPTGAGGSAGTGMAGLGGGGPAGASGGDGGSASGGSLGTGGSASGGSLGTGGAAGGTQGTGGLATGGTAGQGTTGSGGGAGSGGGGGAHTGGSSGSSGGAGAGGGSGLPWLTVNGNKLQDPTGKTIILRGSALIDIGSLYWYGGQSAAGITARMDKVAAAGVQGHVVRLPVYPEIDYNTGGGATCSPCPYPVGTGPTASCTPKTPLSAADYFSKVL